MMPRHRLSHGGRAFRLRRRAVVHPPSAMRTVRVTLPPRPLRGLDCRPHLRRPLPPALSRLPHGRYVLLKGAGSAPRPYLESYASYIYTARYIIPYDSYTIKT